MDGGDGCKPLDGEKFAGKWVVVTSEGCGAGTAAGHATGGGTAGAIVIAAKGKSVEELGSCGQGVATVISNDDGTALLAALAKAGGAINGSFASIRQPGAFAAIDGAGRAQELGWEKYSTLEMLSWAAQYFDYKAALAVNASKPAYIVPTPGNLYRVPSPSICPCCWVDL